MKRAPELGRLRGVFIPVTDVLAYEANGWMIVDDMAGSVFANDEVLMAAPERREESAA